MALFPDRAAAGRTLGELLAAYAGRRNIVVLGLARGGVPVAFEVAKCLHAPMDVMIVRKLGAPTQPEFALGAIASGGVIVTNPYVKSLLDYTLMSHSIAEQRVEIDRREKLYRGQRSAAPIRDRLALLVDDGAATGSSMLAAVRAARKLGAKEVVVAVPVASEEAYAALAREANRVVCASVPQGFSSVGQWYGDFSQVSDDEVIALLSRVEDVQSQPAHLLRPEHPFESPRH